MYLINPWWFYLIGIAECVQGFLLAIGIVGMLAMCIIAFLFAIDDDKVPKFCKPIAILCAIMIFIGTLIPNQKLVIPWQ